MGVGAEGRRAENRETVPMTVTRCGPDAGGNFEFHWSNGYLDAHYISDVGRKRQHNEDACIFCAPEDLRAAVDRGVLFAIADGMGGASAGERASHLALKIIGEEFYSGENGVLPERLRNAIERANARVFTEAEDNPAYHGMGTTISALLVAKDCAYIGQVGDSRVYISRNGLALHQVTEDHSLVAEQLRSGLINEEEARNHSMKNLITRAVGIKEAVQVDLYSLQLKKGDTLLICSDGLSNLVDDEDIADSLRMDNLQAAARVLVGKALEAGGSDNISVALVRVMQTLPHAELQEGGEVVTLSAGSLLKRLRRRLGN